VALAFLFVLLFGHAGPFKLYFKWPVFGPKFGKRNIRVRKHTQQRRFAGCLADPASSPYGARRMGSGRRGRGRQSPDGPPRPPGGGPLADGPPGAAAPACPAAARCTGPEQPPSGCTPRASTPGTAAPPN